jgi:hypothetical protein
MNFEKPHTDAPVTSPPPDAAPRRAPEQVVAGLMPPQLGEAPIREVRPGVKSPGGGFVVFAVSAVAAVVAIAAALFGLLYLAGVSGGLAPLVIVAAVLLLVVAAHLLLVAGIAVSDLTAGPGKTLLRLPSAVAGKLPSVPVVTAVLWPIVWTALALICLPLSWFLLLPGFVKKIFPFICRRYTLTNRRLMIQRGLKPHPIQEIALADIDDVRLEAATFDEFFNTADLDVVSRGQTALKLHAVPEPENFRRSILNAVHAWAPGKAAGPFVPASAKT